MEQALQYQTLARLSKLILGKQLLALRLHPSMNTKLHRQNSSVKLRHGQPEMGHDPRLPILRKPLLNQHRRQIINAAAENRQHGRRVRAPEHVVEQALGIVLVLHPRRSPPLAQSPAQIGFRQESLAVTSAARGAVEEFADEVQIGLSLVGDEG